MSRKKAVKKDQESGREADAKPAKRKGYRVCKGRSLVSQHRVFDELNVVTAKDFASSDPEEGMKHGKAQLERLIESGIIEEV